MAIRLRGAGGVPAVEWLVAPSDLQFTYPRKLYMVKQKVSEKQTSSRLCKCERYFEPCPVCPVKQTPTSCPVGLCAACGGRRGRVYWHLGLLAWLCIDCWPEE